MIVISTLRVGDIRLRRVISIPTEWVIYFPTENVKEDADASCSAYALLTLGLRPSLFIGTHGVHMMPAAGSETFAKQIFHICEAYISYSPTGEYFTRRRRISLS